jgi:serine/threonine protein kinase
VRPLEPSVERSAPPPRLNGRYIVTRLLGKGAQARVYLAWDGRLKQWRAAKVLASNYVDDEHVRGRFLLEAEAMARLSHPNILRVLDVDSDGRTPYIVMELARGGAVTEWLKRNGPMPAGLACHVIRQACQGLDHAHSLGIVHRDVKPHNLLLRADGSVVLVDFGIAQVAEVAMTQTGSVMGTFAYMSPEQRNDAKSVDNRADVYALGASLYTMLTLRTSAELFFAEARDEILAGVPDPLKHVVIRACRYDRNERTPSMAVFAAEVEAAMSRLPPVPKGMTLTDSVMPLPDGVPAFVDDSTGVGDLRSALAMGSDEQPTYMSANKGSLERMLEEQPTTLYSDSNPDNGPAIPYQMPSVDWSAARPRADAESQESVLPEYVDVSTLHSGTTPNENDVEIGSAGRLSQQAPRPEPEPVVEPPVERSPWAYTFGAVGAAILLLVLVFAWGTVSLRQSRSNVLDAETSLIAEMPASHALVEDLVSSGGNAGALEYAWFAYLDAPPEEKAGRAASFVVLAAAEARRVSVGGATRTQVTRLELLTSSWQQAQSTFESRSSSRIGRLIASMGL